MPNLITAAQMREADAYTIKHKPIFSIKLMENAAKAFVGVFKRECTDRTNKISIVCGPGNNGGDGLAIARLLEAEKYKQIKVYLLKLSVKYSDDFEQNLKQLSKAKVQIQTIDKAADLKLEADIIIDAILGSGLNKPLTGFLANIAELINQSKSKVIAVDVPTGLLAEGPLSSPYLGVKADVVISFQRPKLNFFFPESQAALKRFKVVEIGLDEQYVENRPSNWKMTDKGVIQKLIKPRANFSHKGTYGHALLIAGNTATMGAALLSAKACLHTGAGLTTVCLPENGMVALNTALPEVMSLNCSANIDEGILEKFTAIGIGPGLGNDYDAERLMSQLIELKEPMVIDADGLNILAKRRDLLDLLPADSILTPHLKEFDRIFGEQRNWWERVNTAKIAAQHRRVIIVLKNQYTFVCLPNGEIHINPTGGPAMASGGMGDVLTGIITALLAQRYPAAEAAILGVYLHGKAGDKLAKNSFVVSASEVAAEVPKVMKRLAE
ncbi:MAG: NAD(P)H-hydrate dehydratase [Pedobacter sp.]|nr:NAD(P)H-hydrate dehydratase [Pedobacter sp.]MDQ8053559.1 NAD(P)H-hydrate dehydratase [Pedobacter sp.]